MSEGQHERPENYQRFEKMNYVGGYPVLYASEGKMQHQIERWIGVASVVMQSLYQSVLVKKALS